MLSILPHEQYGQFFRQLKCILLKHMYVYIMRLGNETMVCAVCLSVSLWICDMARLLHGTFLSWWYLSRIWPSVTAMQHYCHVSYHGNDWHLACMFSLGYFSVEVVPGRRVSPFCQHKARSCDRVCAPLTLAPLLMRKQIRSRVDPFSTWARWGAFEQTHWSARIIGWPPSVYDILLPTIII